MPPGGRADHDRRRSREARLAERREVATLRGHGERGAGPLRDARRLPVGRRALLRGVLGGRATGQGDADRARQLHLERQRRRDLRGGRRLLLRARDQRLRDGVRGVLRLAGRAAAGEPLRPPGARPLLTGRGPPRRLPGREPLGQAPARPSLRLPRLRPRRPRDRGEGGRPHQRPDDHRPGLDGGDGAPLEEPGLPVRRADAPAARRARRCAATSRASRPCASTASPFPRTPAGASTPTASTTRTSRRASASCASRSARPAPDQREAAGSGRRSTRRR